MVVRYGEGGRRREAMRLSDHRRELGVDENEELCCSCEKAG